MNDLYLYLMVTPMGENMKNISINGNAHGSFFFLL